MQPSIFKFQSIRLPIFRSNLLEFRIKGRVAFSLHLASLLFLLFFTTREFVIIEREWLWFVFGIIFFYIIPGKAIIELLKWDGPVLFWLPVSLSFGFFMQGGLLFIFDFFFLEEWFRFFLYSLSSISLIYLTYKRHSIFGEIPFKNEEFSLNHLLLYIGVFSILSFVPVYYGMLDHPQGKYSVLFDRHTTNIAESLIFYQNGIPYHGLDTWGAPYKIFDFPIFSGGSGDFKSFPLLVFLTELNNNNLLNNMYLFWTLCYFSIILLAYNFGRLMSSELLGLLFSLFAGSILFSFNLYYGLNFLFFQGEVAQLQNHFFNYHPDGFGIWLLLFAIFAISISLKNNRTGSVIMSGILVMFLVFARIGTMMPFSIALGAFILFSVFVKRNYKPLILTPFLLLGVDLLSLFRAGAMDSPMNPDVTIAFDANWHWFIKNFNYLNFLTGSNAFADNPNLFTWIMSLFSMTLYSSGIGVIALLCFIAKPWNIVSLVQKENSTHLILAGTILSSLVLGLLLYVKSGSSLVAVFVPYFFLMNFYAAWVLKDYSFISYFIIITMLVGIFWQPWIVGKVKEPTPSFAWKKKQQFGLMLPIKNFDNIYKGFRFMSGGLNDKDKILWLLNKEDVQILSEKVLCRMMTGMACFTELRETNIQRVIATIDKFNINKIISKAALSSNWFLKITKEGFVVNEIKTGNPQNGFYLYQLERAL